MSWSPSNVFGRRLLAIASLLITAVAATTSFAQTQQQILQQRNVCFGREAAAAGAQLIACTAIIESGREQPTIVSQAHTVRGNLARAKDELDQAIDEYSLAIQLDGRNATAYYSRGLSRAAKGDVDSAINDYSEAIQNQSQGWRLL